jgi:hypothetical protein
MMMIQERETSNTDKGSSQELYHEIRKILLDVKNEHNNAGICHLSNYKILLIEKL